MQDAIILGGGISGLTAAYLAQRSGHEVSVIEKRKEAGGPVSSFSEDGYLVERGPNSLLLPDPWVESLIEEVGLKGQLIETDPLSKRRYIAKNGKPIPVPESPIQAIFTPLFSLRGKLNVLLEPFRKPISERSGSTETVANFVHRRLGQDFLDYAIDPFVSGVYAGDPNRLILEYAFPLMRGFERDHGSIVRGALKLKKDRRQQGDTFKKRSISFADGLGTLPKTLARKLGNRLWLDSEVVAVNRIDNAWQVTWKRDGENFEGFAKKLFVCLPSYATKSIAWSHGIAEPLQATPRLSFPSVHSLALGFMRSQIQHPLDGFGVLVPSKEPQTILGTLFSSSLFPERAPDGHCLLTTMIGGERHPELAARSKEELLQIALSDLRPLIGLKGEPSFIQCSSWPRAIPQYTAEFGTWKNTLHALEETFPGLHFGGNCVDGIALGSAIMSGRRLATTLDS